MSGDQTRMVELGQVGAGLGAADRGGWRCEWRVEKYHAGAADVIAGRHESSTNPPERYGSPVEPYEVIEREGNLLMYGGADVLWLGLRTGLSATTGLANTKFDNTNACIRVGNSSAAAAATQTDLQGGSKRGVGMQATFPTHTSGTAASTSSKMLFKSVFTSSQANFAWQEWGITNKVSSAGGRMLNRKVESLGTKTSAAVWTFTVTLSLA